MLSTPTCCIYTSSKMANMVMLEWFIENVCQIAVMWEAFIINVYYLMKTIKIKDFYQLSGFNELLEINVTCMNWPSWLNARIFH